MSNALQTIRFKTFIYLFNYLFIYLFIYLTLFNVGTLKHLIANKNQPLNIITKKQKQK